MPNFIIQFILIEVTKTIFESICQLVGLVLDTCKSLLQRSVLKTVLQVLYPAYDINKSKRSAKMIFYCSRLLCVQLFSCERLHFDALRFTTQKIQMWKPIHLLRTNLKKWPETPLQTDPIDIYQISSFLRQVIKIQEATWDTETSRKNLRSFDVFGMKM